MTPLARGILTSAKLGIAKYAKYFMSKFNPSYGVEVPDDNTLDMTNDFSGCLWVYPHNRNTTQRLMNKYVSTGNQKSWHFDITSSGFLAFTHSTNGSAETVFISAIDVPLSTLSLVHFRLTGGTLYLGKNGASELIALRGACFSSTSPVDIGSILGTVFSDDLDTTQAMLFNSGSSLANFETIYNGGVPLKYPLLPTAITDDAVMAFEMSSNDTTITDLSGTGNDGAFFGGSFTNGYLATWQISPSTIFNNTLLLNGASQYITLPNIDNTSIRTSVTMCAWVKSSSAVDQTIIGIGTASSVMDLRFLSGNASMVTYSGSFGAVSASNPITTEFVHIACTYDGVTAKIYHNGILEASAALSPANLSISNAFTVGVHRDLSSGLLNGPTANAMVFDVVLSAANLLEIVNSGKPKQPEDYTGTITNNYIMALPLNDGVVDPYIDRSLNSNDGTAVGSPTFTGEQLEFES